MTYDLDDTQRVLLLKMNKLCMLLYDTSAIVVVKLLYFGVNNECGKADFWQKTDSRFSHFFNRKSCFGAEISQKLHIIRPKRANSSLVRVH